MEPVSGRCEMEVICPYCQLPAELIDSVRIYKKSYGMVWICQPCEAWVGVLQDSKTNKPKGTLAKAELRELRVKTHEAFDPLWKTRWESIGGSKSKSRNHYYNELSIELKLDHKDCHIGKFDESQCRAVIEICAGWKRAAAEAAARLPESLE